LRRKGKFLKAKGKKKGLLSAGNSALGKEKFLKAKSKKGLPSAGSLALGKALPLPSVLGVAHSKA